MNAALYGLKEYLIQQSGQVTLLVLLVAGLCWVLRYRSAHVRYMLWLVVIAKCLVPPLMTIPIAILPSESTVVVQPAMAPTEPVSFSDVSMTPMAEVPVSETTLGDILKRHAWVSLWLGGVVAFGVVMIVRSIAFQRRLLQQRIPVPSSLKHELESLQAHFGASYQVSAWLTPQTSQPFVWGLWRGHLYLPQYFLEHTDPVQRRMILAHELAHVSRCDPLINALQILVQALFWFHPLVWWANLQIRREREKCCDEMAIAVLNADVKDYCNTIVDVLVQQCPRRLPLGSVAIAGPVRNIEERIKTLMNPNKSFNKKAGRLSALSICLFAVFVVSSAVAVTEKNGSEPNMHYTDFQQTEEEHHVSIEIMKQLSSLLLSYTNNHEGRLPESLAFITLAQRDTLGINENKLDTIMYVGEGKLLDNSKADVILAYPFEQLLFPDPIPFLFFNGQVELYTLEQIREKGISIPTQTTYSSTLPKSLMTSAKNKYKTLESSKDEYPESLRRIGDMILSYEKAHGQRPTNLQQLLDKDQDALVQWALKDIFLLSHPIAGIIAYDQTLLFKGEGTHVLYSDGSVKYLGRAQLVSQGLVMDGKFLANMELIIASSQDNGVVQYLAQEQLGCGFGQPQVITQSQKGRLLSVVRTSDNCSLLSTSGVLDNNAKATLKLESDDTAIDSKTSAFQFNSVSMEIVPVKDQIGDVFLSMDTEFDWLLSKRRFRRMFSSEQLLSSNHSVIYTTQPDEGEFVCLTITLTWYPAKD